MRRQGRMLPALLAAVGGIMAWTPPAAADWKAPREALDDRRQVGDVAIHFTRDGDHAFPADAAKAGERDRFLDRMAAQIADSERVYRQDLGLLAPLDMPRYQDGRRIDVHIYDFGKGMGSAGDELHLFDYARFGREGPALAIAISSRWTPPNRTPEHEIFHAYQYAYTFFKNPWYLEGLARSMESLFRTDGKAPRTEPLPADDASLDELLGRSYGADVFWNRLARLCDPGCATTPGGSAPACGRAVVRPLLEALDVEDDRAARDRTLPHDRWPEAEQRSAANTPYMLAALARVVEQQCPLRTSPELARFHEVLTRRLDAGESR